MVSVDRECVSTMAPAGKATSKLAASMVELDRIFLRQPNIEALIIRIGFWGTL